MPLYEYECPKCEKRREVLIRDLHAADTRCPECGTPMQKVLSAAAVPPSGTYSYGSR